VPSAKADLGARDSLGAEGFDGCTGALGAAPLVAFPGFFEGCERAFAAAFFAGFADCARLALVGDVLDDFRGVVFDAFPEACLVVFFDVFLRVFLDIRLPFVAFGGSINRGIAGPVFVSPNRANRWANLMASEYGYQDSTHHPTLVERALWAE
jgi:hypothetical protein